jgi:hypothetical protein
MGYGAGIAFISEDYFLGMDMTRQMLYVLAGKPDFRACHLYEKFYYMDHCRKSGLPAKTYNI